MTAVENRSPPPPRSPLPPPPPPPPAPAPAYDEELYHSDDVGLRDTTPPLEAKKLQLGPPRPSPPIHSSPDDTPESSPEPPGDRDRKHSPHDPNRHHRRSKPRRRPKHRPTQGDAVLISHMDGKWSDLAARAGQEALPSPDEDDADDTTTTSSNQALTTVDDVEKDVGSLAAIAANALAHQGQAAQGTVTRGPQNAADAQRVGGVPVGDGKHSMPAIAPTHAGDARAPQSQDVSIKPEAVTSTGGLPPIRQHSPQSHLSNGNGTGSITLPSIAAQLGNLNHLPNASGDSPFPQSPPAQLPHVRYPAAPNHGSPPKSPNDTFHRRGLPSPSGPSHYYYAQGNHQRIAQADGTQYASAGDYSSSNTETPSTENSAATPALPIDRMSIDGITNPQVGGFQCTYPGCTAAPFQTQVSCRQGARGNSIRANGYLSIC